MLRATSPSATFDQVSSGSSATQSHSSRHYQHQHHHHHHQQHYQQHQLQSASSTKDAGAGVGIRSESSTGLPNGGAGGSSSSSSLTKKSNSATQLSMTGKLRHALETNFARPANGLCPTHCKLASSFGTQTIYLVCSALPKVPRSRRAAEVGTSAGVI